MKELIENSKNQKRGEGERILFPIKDKGVNETKGG